MFRRVRGQGLRSWPVRAGALLLFVAAGAGSPEVASASVTSLAQGKGIALSPNPITSTGTISLAVPLSLSLPSSTQLFTLTNTSTVAKSAAIRAQGHTFGISGFGGSGGEGVFGGGGTGAFGVVGAGGGAFAGVVGNGGPSDGPGGIFQGTSSGATDHGLSGAGVIATGAAANPPRTSLTAGGTGVRATGGNDTHPVPTGGVAGIAGTGVVANGGVATNGNIGGTALSAVGGSGTLAGGDGIDAAPGNGPGALAGRFTGGVTVTGTLTVSKLVVSTTLAFQPVTLLNGWAGGPFGTASPAVAVDAQGIVHFRGAIHQNGTFKPIAFVLPAQFRPGHTAFLTVDMLSVTTGRIEVDPDGTVTVQDGASGTNAQGFTSLDGVTYALG